MASIQKTAKGYRAQVFVRGQRDSAMFRTRREAEAWAAVREVELRAMVAAPLSDRHTLAQAIERYVEEVLPSKRGARREGIALQAMQRQPSFPTGEKMGSLTPAMFAAWRDARLGQVAAGTVIREFGLLSSVLEVARREWGWLASNPLREVRKPRAPDHREVVITRQQVRMMLESMGYRPRGPVRSVSQAVAVCFLVALRSGMRAGELCGLTWDRVAEDHCELPVTKTTPRDVPLTSKAVRLVEKMRGFDPDLVFGIKAASLDALFRKHRNRAGLEGFTFHDSRHTAATWLARRLDVLDLCRMFGWANPKQALAYYNPSASSIAALLNATPHGRTPARGRPR
ncbi:MAG: tyrosine-type recombinase/integrase [Rhodocyclales bacterium]|nr:tyrosine-type recombinase/integrase [Rhodocyclales bacterium]